MQNLGWFNARAVTLPLGAHTTARMHARTHARPLQQQVFSWPLSGKTEEVNWRALVHGARCVTHLCRINMSEVPNAARVSPSEPARRPGDRNFNIWLEFTFLTR